MMKNKKQTYLKTNEQSVQYIVCLQFFAAQHRPEGSSHFLPPAVRRPLSKGF